ncbi:MAG: hypothetical protein VCC01_07410 [Candidatus Hydrogenedentota bacterium]
MTRRIESYPSPGALSPRLALLAIFFFAAFYAYPATVTVNVVEFTFNPRGVNINQGDTIQWTGGNGTHTVTSGASPFSADGLFNATGAVFNPTFSYAF